jgi:hypothetical protein
MNPGWARPASVLRFCFQYPHLLRCRAHKFAARKFPTCADVAAHWRPRRSHPWHHLHCALCRASIARAIRSSRRLGRHFCWSNRSPRRLAGLRSARNRSAYHLDLESSWNARSERRDRLRRDFVARPSAVDFLRTELGHHDNVAVAFDSRFFGSTSICSSHRHFCAIAAQSVRSTTNIRAFSTSPNLFRAKRRGAFCVLLLTADYADES